MPNSDDSMQDDKGKTHSSVGEWRPGRRTLLSRAGIAAGVCGAVGVSGCLSLFGDDTVTVGYDPSFRTLQGAILVQEGYLDEVDASITVTNYRDENVGLDGDFVEGNVQVALTTVDWAIKQSNGPVPARITAANTVDDCILLAGDAFAELWADHGADAFERFRERNDRPFELLSLSPGLDARIAARWLSASGVSADSVERKFGGYGGEAIRQLWQDGEIDGAFVSPTLSSVLVRSTDGLQHVAGTHADTATQPGGVTAMTESFLNERPDVARKIVEKHVKATEFIDSNPADAAAVLDEELGDDLSSAAASRAVESKAANFVTDPRQIVDGVDALADAMADDGVVGEGVSADAVVDSSYYAEGVGND